MWAALSLCRKETRSKEEASEEQEDDGEEDRALQDEQDMQEWNDEDKDDEPARPKRGRGTAVRRHTADSAMRKLVGGILSRHACTHDTAADPDTLQQAQHARAAFLPQDQELDTLGTDGLLRCMIKANAGYHAEKQAIWGELLAAVKKGSVARPSAGKGESASKALGRLVGTHLREVSYYPSEDDYEHMAALRLKCENVKETYARPEGAAEVNSIARQARELARRTYRAPAIAECKKAICSEFPEAFKSGGKGFITAQAIEFREKRYRKGMGIIEEEKDDYAEARYREDLLQAYRDAVPGNADAASITHLTASQLALMELVMDLPLDNKSLESLRSTYRGLLAQAAARRSRYIIVKPPQLQAHGGLKSRQMHYCSAVECRSQVEAVSCQLRLSRQLPPSTGSLAVAGCLFAIA